MHYDRLRDVATALQLRYRDRRRVGRRQYDGLRRAAQLERHLSRRGTRRTLDGAASSGRSSRGWSFLGRDMTHRDLTQVLENIANCDEPDKLRRYMKNAREREVDDVYDAAFQRLILVQPSAQVGTVAHDVWRTIHAFEELLRQERGKTIRLSRTRQAITRKGEVRTVIDLVRKRDASEGFRMLQERNLLELSFEAIVVARLGHFPTEVVEQARVRLENASVDFDRVHEYWQSG